MSGPSRSNDCAVCAENLTKDFGNFRAVDHITFDVPRGQIFGFLGPNGSGKTTTIRMLLGLLRPTDGTAEDPWRRGGILQRARISLNYSLRGVLCQKQWK